MALFKKIFRVFSHSERVTFFTATALVIVSGATLASLILSAYTTIAPAAGGTYTEGAVGQPTFINPVIAASDMDKSLVRLIFSSVPDIAQKIETDPDSDRRVWRVRLKEGLVWQDEEKLTSDDIIFTVNRIQDPNSQSPLFANWQGVAVSRLSELEVQFNLVNPYAFFTDNLKNLYILPKHLFAGVPPANWRLSEYNLKPVGSGPYQFETYDKQPGGFIGAYYLTASPTYSGDRPLIGSFTFRFFTKTEDQLRAFNNGQVDGFVSFEPENAKHITRPYETVPFRVPGYYAVFLNQSKNIALKDVAARQALTVAVDKAALIQDVFDGNAVLVNGPIPPAAAHFTPPDTPENFSPDTARALLDKNGWILKNDGAVRQKSVGKQSVPLEVTLTVPDIPFLQKTAQTLQKNWAAVGIKVNIAARSPEEINNVAIKNRDYEMLLFGNALNASSDLYSFWHSAERFYPGLNLSLYNDKRVDSLIETVRQDFGPKSAEAEFAKLQAYITADYPAVFLYSPDYPQIVSKNVRGLATGLLSEPADRFRNVARWYVKTARVLKARE